MNEPCFRAPVERRVIRPGQIVTIRRDQDRLGKPKYPGRVGFVDRENSVASGWWYIKLTANSKSKETIELFHENDFDV